jgi:ubiquinol-cytochrome c reductase iron-sulfur subunit
MASTASSATTAGHPPMGTRRDFLYIATATVGAVGAAATLVPFVDQMNPDASTLAAGGPVDLDVSKIGEGQQVLVRWRQRPIFVFRRSKQTLDAMQSKELTSQLADPNSDQLQQPPYAANWHRSLKPELGVLVGICTHLGCIPLFYPNASATTPVASWLGGYFCPCHGSKYDAAGRVFSGVPAPYNLPVPPYRFVNDKTLRIGENDASATAWNFDTIRQL